MRPAVIAIATHRSILPRLLAQRAVRLHEEWLGAEPDASAPPRYGGTPQDLLAPACLIYVGSLFSLRFPPLASFVQNSKIGYIKSPPWPQVSSARGAVAALSR